MPERIETIATPDGGMETFIAEPRGEARRHVILYMDVWGIRDELYDIARGLARDGLVCLLPDLYYREGRVRHDFRDAEGRARTLLSLTPAEQEHVRGPMRRLTDAMVMADTRALLGRMNATRAAVAIGYCMGGRHALVAGGTFPHVIRAAASLHGSHIVDASADSPHIVAARIVGEAYCGFAERDPFAAEHVIDALRRQFAETGARLVYRVHRGAEHGYALPDRDVHDAEATRADWTAIHAMIDRMD
jgi:carboxymethylenebutenolidase